MKGKYCKYEVDPVISDFDDAIELLIFELEKCPFKLDKSTMMKLLGMVYGEEFFILHENFIQKNKEAVNFWLTFAVCIKRYLGKMQFDEVDETKITDQTNKMKEDKIFLRNKIWESSCRTGIQNNTRSTCIIITWSNIRFDAKSKVRKNLFFQ